MRTIEIKLYSYDELSEKAKEVAIQKLWDINVNYEWWEFTYEDAENIGLKLDGFDLDRNNHATGKFISIPDDCANRIIAEHGETCETSKTAKAFLKEKEEFFTKLKIDDREDLTSEIEADLEDMHNKFLKDLLHDYAMMLQKEYEYLTEKERVIESIEANTYEFTEEGKLRNF